MLQYIGPTTSAVVMGWFYEFSPLPPSEIMTKNLISLKLVSLFTVTPPPRKPMMMYSVSHCCAKIHRFKAKAPKIFPTPLVIFGHSFVCPHPHIHPPNEMPEFPADYCG